ncbi:GGDEF domain-containing response regulator [Paenibacillus tarimensis]|uniref:GGDEF domain-containing response regulator n=1 Tax=Paenibacillus tarimensis TaxID=416012 RepID=UPI001F3F502C|nr:response regulator [Paenibacillus tarimensis]MCF2942744.1 response regulator [Paenibacillus tarimensis]
MRKYQEALISSIQTQMAQWFEQEHNHLSYDELYRFLHSVSGTSGTIGMDAVSNKARQLMNELGEHTEEPVPIEEARSLLLPLLAECYGSNDQDSMLPEALLTMSVSGRKEQPIVLVADEDATFLIYMKEELEKRGYMVLATTDSHETMKYLHDYRPDCLVLDLYLKQMNGYDLILSLREKMKYQYIPTTIVCEADDRATRIQAYRLGADDFIAKPFDMGEFTARLERQLERKKLFDRIQQHDMMTGALKQELWREEFSTFINCLESEEHFVLALTDVNDLRTINEESGPHMGDQVICAAGEALRGVLSAEDVLIRYSGAKFLILSKDAQGAEDKMELAVERFAQVGFQSDKEVFHASMTVGATRVGRSSIGEVCVARAQAALEKAKRSGLPVYCCQQGGEGLRRTIRVAIIDNDLMIRSLLTEHAKSVFPDYVDGQIRSYRSGEELLDDEWLKSSDPYMIVLDRYMPGMDGLQVLQHLQGLDNKDQFTILMLTKDKNETDMAKALELGADDYMMKPFSIRELEARIRRLAKKLG